MKYAPYIASVLAVVVVAFAGYRYTSTQSKPSATSDTSTAKASAHSGRETQTDSQGEITVVVTPQVLGANDSQWKFEVGFNTHSGSLDFDPMQIVTLVDDSGGVYKPLSWDGPGAGGHHRSGVLTFSAINPVPKTIEIVVKDVGGIPDRTFKWSL